jgi:manganese/iron transport system ATP-binding protein
MTTAPPAAAPAPALAPAPAAAPAPATDGLRLDNVAVTYRNGLTAVRDASFAIPTGSITALVGVNGSGKSTLFKAIMGFVPLARGSVRILGLPVDQALRRNLVAYVPQAEEVDWTFPVLVEDVVMMGRYGHMGWLRRASTADRDKVDAALARVGLTGLRHRQIGELSGGQKKRVFLARALAQEGRVILLDEPFTGVDVTTEADIIALMRELRAEGRVMLVSTHNLGSVPEYCDRTVMINRTILAAGPTAEIFNADNLGRAFGTALRHFVLGGSDLHRDDDDRRTVTVITDDERPYVVYEDRSGARPDARPTATPPSTPPDTPPDPKSGARVTLP